MDEIHIVGERPRKTISQNVERDLDLNGLPLE
jgi:hypothetical protein